MIRCPRCNTELPDGVSFCDACGAPVRAQMPPASPVYQPFADATAGSAGQAACPVCGTPVIPGEAFCDNCGASLLADSGTTTIPSMPPFAAPPEPAPFAPAPPAPPPFAPAPAPNPAPPAPAAAATQTHPPRLVVAATRAELPLPARDDIVIGREDAQSNSFPDVDLNPHGGLEQGVSRRHARLIRRNGQYFIEDLNSVNGTLLNQRRLPANAPTALQPGDQLLLGRLGLAFDGT